MDGGPAERRRRGGRPLAVEGKRRTRGITVRLTDEEYAAWERAATSAGYRQTAAWVRDVVAAALEGRALVRGVGLPREVLLFVAELRHLGNEIIREGNNLNQVARFMNATDGEVPKYAARLLPLVRRNQEMVLDLLERIRAAAGSMPDSAGPDR
ncbi:hypothetical protein TH66_00540 [Carbonactinospora thermoautotrophica]|uniref:Bacterial mobilisation domain-containing protein n=1 Tax=Carbonactinospora thermoautotrophica TaxID=1469144 RepID=A0A132NHQ2_9ACTN|nr:plasmid mobilization relaxosome protein MobC [Carbonactinospora thermoautotrophica]KWX05857.1 hypothetical protein TH66_00540 [Carbonactinospora thermoautotrophica]KWX09609.1 hypothetical protein TR74_08570 [Carbonactinospora thermoautotrophica]